MEHRSKKCVCAFAPVIFTETDLVVTGTSFEDLPIEIIIKIFSYLNQSELENITPRVCKTWREMSFDPHLWKAVEILMSVRCFKEEDCERYVTLLNRCVLLESLLFSTAYFKRMRNIRWANFETPNKFRYPFLPIVPKRLVKCLGAFSSLKKLHFVGCIVRDVEIVYVASNCPLIEDLQFEVCELSSKNFDFESLFDVDSQQEPWPAFSYIAKIENLKVFRLNSVLGSNFGNASLKTFARHCNKLQSINISDHSEITDVGFIELVKLCNETLKELELIGEICEGIQYLGSCKHLVSLKLELVQLTAEGMQALVELPLLETIVLTSTEDPNTDGSSPDGFSSFFSHPYRSHIKEVYLKSFSFGVEALISMADNCQNLQKLNLINCQGITDNGLGQVIENCTELICLDISLSKPLIGKCLHKVKRCLPRLERLELGTLLVKKHKLLSSLKKELPDFQFEAVGISCTFWRHVNSYRWW